MSDNYSFGIQNFGLSDDSKPLIICIFKNCTATKAIKASRVWIGYFFIYKNKCPTKREFLAAVENIISPSYVFDHTYDLDTFLSNELIIDTELNIYTMVQKECKWKYI